MKKASAHQETIERLATLKAEGGHLLLTTKGDSPAAHARLRMIDAKIRSLSGQLGRPALAGPKGS